jgi:tRNA nucleotidyltransferase/poly(A) polymerase
MDERLLQAVGGEDAYIVGGAVRDELLGRPVVDLDVACPAPAEAARAYAGLAGGAFFPLSDRHGAWRVAFRDGRTVDFTPLPDGIEADLGTRDFTINAIAIPLGGGEPVDPLGGRGDLEARVLRAVSPEIFAADPIRLLRAARLEDELGTRLDEETERLARIHAELVASPAGERILGELVRLSPAGFRRLDDLGLLAPLGGSLEKLERAEGVETPCFSLVCVFGPALEGYPVSNRLRRQTRTVLRARRPPDASARSLHRFRRASEPWSREALAYMGANDLLAALEESRASDPAEPLLRGDELGLPPGPDVGRLLEVIAEERAAGTISTREEALDLVRRDRDLGP